MFKNAFLGALLSLFFVTAAAAGTINAQDSGMSTTTGQSSQSILSGTPTAGATFGASTNGGTPGMVTIVVSGTWSGTIQLWRSSDGGQTYAPWNCQVVGGTTLVTSITANGTFDCSSAGASNWLARASSWASGSATIGPFSYLHDFPGGGASGGGGAATIANGADVTQGTIGDTNTQGTVVGFLHDIWAGIGNAIPAGTNLIGKLGIDQTTPGTTNNVTLSTNVGTLPIIQATASAPVSTSSAATLQVVAASGSTVIRVTNWVLITTLANNVTWESGDTGGSCANPVALGGAMPFAANGGALSELVWPRSRSAIWQSSMHADIRSDTDFGFSFPTHNFEDRKMSTRRDVLAGAAVAPLAASLLSQAGAASFDKPKYRGVRYQGWTPPEPHSHITFIQRFESRDTHDFKIVGVQLHGGPMQFVSDEEAAQHVDAIWQAALVEAEREAMHLENAGKSVALHKQLGIAHDPALIHAHHQRAAEEQVGHYHGHVRDIMADRRKKIGPSHPTLALELHVKVMKECG